MAAPKQASSFQPRVVASSPPVARHTAILKERVPLAGRRILDIGCGDGNLVRWMARQGALAVGVEVSPEALTRAKAALPVGSETFLEGRGEALPFHDGDFDAVLYFNALHHVPVPALDAALREANRVLDAEGVLYVAEPVARGPNFELTRLVDDETEVRDAAQAAIDGALDAGLFTLLETLEYTHEQLYTDFAAWREKMVAVDADRESTVDAHAATLRDRFQHLGRLRDDGMVFDQPMRVHLMTKPEA